MAESAKVGQQLSALFGFQDNAWREAMDKFFIHSLTGQAISGNWEESLCHHYIDTPPDGTMYMLVPDGSMMIGIGAHVEGVRSTLPFYENETHIIEEESFQYRLSLYVKNPEEASDASMVDYIKTRTFKVMLRGEKTESLFVPPSIKLEPGETYSKTGRSMITFYSRYRYDKICIEFDSAVFTASGDSQSTVCNVLNEYSGGQTHYGTGSSTGVAGPGGTSVNPNI